ncbi:M17 family peptidase N-terminal domain-containing protein, partial [Pseudoalteromonas ruthenica]
SLSTRLCALSVALFGSASALAADIQFTSKLNEKTDALVVFQDSEQSNAFKFLDRDTRKQLTKALEADKFTGDYGKVVEVLAPVDSKHKRI